MLVNSCNYVFDQIMTNSWLQYPDVFLCKSIFSELVYEFIFHVHHTFRNQWKITYPFANFFYPSKTLKTIHDCLTSSRYNVHLCMCKSKCFNPQGLPTKNYSFHLSFKKVWLKKDFNNLNKELLFGHICT